MNGRDPEFYNAESSDDLIFVGTVREPNKKRKKASNIKQELSTTDLRNILCQVTSADAKTEIGDSNFERCSENRLNRPLQPDQKPKDKNAARLRQLINTSEVDLPSLFAQVKQREQQKSRTQMYQINEPGSSLATPDAPLGNSCSENETENYVIIESSPDAYSPEPIFETDQDSNSNKLTPSDNFKTSNEKNKRRRGRKIPSVDELKNIVIGKVTKAFYILNTLNHKLCNITLQ